MRSSSATPEIDAVRRELAATRDHYTEGVVLGTILIWPELYSDYAAHLDPADFDGWVHSAVWRAMRAIAARGGTPDFAAVIGELRDHHGDEISIVQISRLTDGVPPPVPEGIVQQCRRLRRFTLIRQFIRGQKLNIAALEADPSLMDGTFLEERAEEIEMLRRGQQPQTANGLHSMAEAVAAFVADADAPERQGVGFGFLPLIDRATDGVQPGELMLPLGRTESLKSMVQLNHLRHLVRDRPDGAVLVVTCEMPEAQSVERLLRMESNRSRPQLHDARRCGELDAQQFISRFERVFFLDRGTVSLAEVEARARDVQQRVAPAPLIAVLIDHAGLLTVENATGSYERATANAVGLKQLARQLQTAVFAIVQANRAGKSDKEAVAMESARDSGAFEENADFILGFGPHLDAGTDQAHVKVKLQKNRRGPHVGVAVQFDGHTLRMVEVPIPSESDGGA